MTNLDLLLETFRERLYLPDPDPLLALLGVVAGNRMEGDPLWLLLVAPPSSGKTELLNAVAGLPGVHAAATLTEASLLSGTPGREKAKDAHGGLLKAIGEHGVILCKDFGSVLSMARDARAGVLAALREVYDGSWTRHLGTDGGRTLTWEGRVGLIGGCTPTIDRHHAVMSALGERFPLMRLAPPKPEDLAMQALEHAGRESEMRKALSTTVREFFAGLVLPDEPPTISTPERDYLVKLATFVTRCRSAVERDGYTREIELIAGAESPGRLAITLKRLHDGLATIGTDCATRWRIIRRVGLDSMPVMRRRVFEQTALAGEVDTKALGITLGYPTTTTRRALEDLAAYGVLVRGAGGVADRWRPAECMTACLGVVPEMSGDAEDGQEAVPEMSGDAIEASSYLLPVPVFDDKSGKSGPTGRGVAVHPGLRVLPPVRAGVGS